MRHAGLVLRTCLRQITPGPPTLAHRARRAGELFAGDRYQDRFDADPKGRPLIRATTQEPAEDRESLSISCTWCIGRHYTASKSEITGACRSKRRLSCRPQCARLRCVPFSDGRCATDAIYFEAVGARAVDAHVVLRLLIQGHDMHMHMHMCMHMCMCMLVVARARALFSPSPASCARRPPCAVHGAAPLRPRARRRAAAALRCEADVQS